MNRQIPCDLCCRFHWLEIPISCYSMGLWLYMENLFWNYCMLPCKWLQNRIVYMISSRDQTVHKFLHHTLARWILQRWLSSEFFVVCFSDSIILWFVAVLYQNNCIKLILDSTWKIDLHSMIHKEFCLSITRSIDSFEFWLRVMMKKLCIKIFMQIIGVLV